MELVGRHEEVQLKAKLAIAILITACLGAAPSYAMSPPCYFVTHEVTVDVDLECLEMTFYDCSDNGEIHNGCEEEIGLVYPDGLSGDEVIQAGTSGTFWGFLAQDTEGDGDFAFLVQVTQGDEVSYAHVAISGYRSDSYAEEEGCQVAPGAGVSMPFSVVFILGFACLARRKRLPL